MRVLDRLAWLVAIVLAAGEIARFRGSARFFPMAMDELVVAAVLVLAALRSRTDGPAWHILAWGMLCGLALVLLVETADHQIHGPAKAAGPLYLAGLSILLAIGLWSAARAFRLLRRGRQAD